jgi:hypothetical protein
VKKPAPKVTKTPRRAATLSSPDELRAWLERSAIVEEAHRHWRYFHAERDPAWIIRACDCLRRGGMEVPETWLEAEREAKGMDYKRKRKRRRPFNADRLVKIGELIGQAATFSPKMSKSELELFLAREIFDPGWEGSGDDYETVMRRAKKKLSHLRVLLSKFKSGPKERTKPRKKT